MNVLYALLVQNSEFLNAECGGAWIYSFQSLKLVKVSYSADRVQFARKLTVEIRQ